MIEGNLVNLRAVEYADVDLICEWSMSDAKRSFFMNEECEIRYLPNTDATQHSSGGESWKPL